MKSTIKAEVHILDRILYLLEEDSVSHIIQNDNSFASFIDNLYDKVQIKTADLEQTAAKM